ncbi:MAG: nitroreductase family protein [Thermoplasmatota archaeon]
MLNELLMNNRSYRRFYQERKLSKEEMFSLIGTARYCPSAANRQPLKFLPVYDRRADEKVFPELKWAGYLKNWDGPEQGEHPSAYIIVLLDKEISSDPLVDHGIAAQSILLKATEKGLGGCMLMAFDKERISESLGIPDRYEPILVIALGKPKEEVVLEDVREGKIEYYRDREGAHHVPKRTLDEIVFELPPAP